MNPIESFLQKTCIAYFSVEIALRQEMPTYAGGLGMLAGDTAHSSADLELPMVFVSLVSRAGYVRQEIDPAGRQVTWPNPWQPEQWTEILDAMVAEPIEGREVWVRPWFYRLICPLGHCVPILPLDTDLDQNSPEDREITDMRLAPGGGERRMVRHHHAGTDGRQSMAAPVHHIRPHHALGMRPAVSETILVNH